MALQALGVAEDSPLRNPEQIPFPAPSIRELVRTIDTHVEMVDLEVTSNLNATKHIQVQTPPADPPTKDAPKHSTEDASQLSPTNPSV